MQIFKRSYDGESLYDLERDISESVMPDFNPKVKDIPLNEWDMLSGEFTVTIEWVKDDA